MCLTKFQRENFCLHCFNASGQIFFANLTCHGSPDDFVTLGEFREVVVPSSEASSRPSLVGAEDESAFAAAQVLSCITPRGYTPVQSAFAKVGLASCRESENEQRPAKDSPDQN